MFPRWAGSPSKNAGGSLKTTSESLLQMGIAAFISVIPGRRMAMPLLAVPYRTGRCEGDQQDSRYCNRSVRVLAKVFASRAWCPASKMGTLLAPWLASADETADATVCECECSGCAATAT